MRFSVLSAIIMASLLCGGLMQACGDDGDGAVGVCQPCSVDSDCQGGLGCFTLGGFCAKTCQTDNQCSTQPDCENSGSSDPMTCCNDPDAAGFCVCH